MKKKVWACMMSGLLLLTFPGMGLAASFEDVDGHWAAPAINQVAGWGLMQGIAEGVFAPDMTVSRAQAATVLVNLFNLDWGGKQFIRQPLATDYYTDVSMNDWFAGSLVMCGINQIFPNGSFYPDQAISRIDMASAIQKSFNAKGISVPMIMMMPVFQDTETLTNEQLQAIAFVNNTAIMKGQGQMFRPNDSMSRAELAQILCNIKEVLKNQESQKPSSDVDASFDGKEYKTTVGKSFVLSLASNPTTGFEWALSDTMDKSIVSMVNHDYKSDSAPEGWTGVGGTDYWTFKALKNGVTEIKLVYARPWESVQPVKTFTLKVMVGEGEAVKPVITVTTKEVKEESDYMKSDLKIPVFSGFEKQDVQTALNAMLEKEILDFKKEVASSLSEYLKDAQENNYTPNPYGADTNFEICTRGKDVLSFYVDYYQYTGGAHGGTARTAYNIDLKIGKNLAIKELFKSGYDYRTVINAEIQRQINLTPDEYFDGDIGFKGITDEAYYYVKDGCLVVYFQQYEIAAYARGIPEFSIPLSTFGSQLAYNLE
ncbi:MAG: protease inhibitor I42 family protein [Syntrophomonadaceae bacterium]